MKGKISRYLRLLANLIYDDVNYKDKLTEKQLNKELKTDYNSSRRGK